VSETGENPQVDQVGDTPFFDLISAVVRQFWDQTRGEFALVRAETTQIISQALTGMLLGLFAILITLIALTQFAASLASGFMALGLAPVLAHLSAGLTLLVVAGVLAWVASRKLRLSALIPVRTIRNLELDAASLRPFWSKEGISR
jgi:hypothetical protein